MNIGNVVEIQWNAGEPPLTAVVVRFDRGFHILKNEKGDRIVCRLTSLYSWKVISESR